jgi:hypothetical protein
MNFGSDMEKSVTNSESIKTLLKSTLTDKINDREVFMKGWITLTTTSKRTTSQRMARALSGDSAVEA